ncbi:MAG: alanine racemase, partial [Acidobacteriota bacterium]
MSDRHSLGNLPHRPTWARVDLGNLRHNYRVLRQRLDPGAGLMAVLKANAYG